MKQRKNVAGRFTKVSNDPIVIGTIGNVCAAQLHNDQIECMKAFCGAVGRDHVIVKDWPVPRNRSMYNDFIIIK